MFSKFLVHLRRQWMGALALFLVLTGGVAYAANTVFSSDIVDGEVKAADIGANAVYSAEITDGQVKGADLGADAVTSGKIADGQVLSGDVKDFSLGNGDFLTGSVDGRVATDNSLTGADVKDQSGVDTCTHGTVRFDELCVGVAGVNPPGRNWSDAVRLCAGLGLRLPSLGEAVALAREHDLPNVEWSEYFFTDHFWSFVGSDGETKFNAFIVVDDGVSDGAFTTVRDRNLNLNFAAFKGEVVCVTTPTN